MSHREDQARASEVSTRTCQVCGAPLDVRQRKYCSRACNITATTRRRDPGYFKAYRSEHAGKVAASRKKRRIERTCTTCGTTWKTHRQEAIYCSTICRLIGQGAPTVSEWPRPEPVEHARQCARCGALFTTCLESQVYCSNRCQQRARDQRRTGLEPWVPEQRECSWCGEDFVPKRRVETHCSGICGDKAGRARRRAREAGAVGTYTWAEVMRVFLLLGRCCGYCRQPVVGQPDPDHVVPLSRGGSNSITNILPACRPCNADKRDLTLDEWASDRMRRRLPPVLTVLPYEPGYMHLTSVPTGLADPVAGAPGSGPLAGALPSR